MALRIVVAGAMREAAAPLRSTIEREFMPRVLDAFEAALHARYGEHAIIRVRALQVRWTVDPRQLVDPGAISRMGAELAEGLVAEIDARPRSQRALPRSNDGVVLLRDHHHARAVCLGAPGTPWFLDAAITAAGARTREAAWEAACAEGAPAVRAVLDWLVEMDRVWPGLATVSPEALERAATRLPWEAWPAEAAAAAHASLARGRPAAVPTRAAPGTQSASDSLRAHAHESTVAPAIDPSTRAGHSQQPHVRSDARPQVLDHAHDRQAPGSVPSSQPAADAQRAPGTPPTPPTEISSRAGAHGSEPGPAPTALPADHTAAEPDRTMPALTRVVTDFAGVFYLAGCVLEIDLAEHLWCAGLREGVVLCHIARALLGARGARDPAPRLFGGIAGEAGAAAAAGALDPALGAVPDWAVEEVVARTQSSMAAALARRWASAPGDLAAVVETLAGATLPLSEQDIDPTAIPLVARAAAMLAYHVAARLGIAPAVLARGEAADLVALVVERLAVPGCIVYMPESVRVEMPMSAIDIDLRRAGLDFDPGYVPWLERTLRLVFSGSDES
jgi:hypothetical protein